MKKGPEWKEEEEERFFFAGKLFFFKEDRRIFVHREKRIRENDRDVKKEFISVCARNSIDYCDMIPLFENVFKNWLGLRYVVINFWKFYHPYCIVL